MKNISDDAKIINENDKPNDRVKSIISTLMTRNRNMETLKESNAFVAGVFLDIKNMPPKPVIVDIGCGDGIAIEEIHTHLKRYHPTTYGIDIVPPIEHPQTIFIHQDLWQWLQLPEKADRIQSWYALQYVPNALSIIQDAFAQTKPNGIWMFHLGPLIENIEGKIIEPLSHELAHKLIVLNKWCNIRIFKSTGTKNLDGSRETYPGQFLTYQKWEEDTPFLIPENILAEKGNMYNPDYRNSEKFYNFSI